jgi:RPA family protein
MASHSLIDLVLIVGSICRKECDGTVDLFKKRARPRGVIGVFPGQFQRDNLTRSRIDADV